MNIKIFTFKQELSYPTFKQEIEREERNWVLGVCLFEDERRERRVNWVFILLKKIKLIKINNQVGPLPAHLWGLYVN
jgi:hypothetical protein